ncbi:MAG: LysR family transcriptional regulator [Halomonas meridiana]|jgi:DNA-binding transcriptional LysR family regulator|uniref:LysR substrate-binding domain-containing protein n=1 Tax=Halomonadaceae TaxID=28256 RepID=UPI001E335886|nr:MULTISPECIES: LysR substrate-binding domain-containing protein [Halomonas]MCE7521116.1 LysR substrate-binding domain-containing protein [Halomonas titanicae]MDK2751050.1 LysR family transcriptional regulator [Halomonas meridiana]|tara:strand:+ start:8070 stop:9005 length:936 start_codon:yes stop_codon:yes gene_type:complete
MPSLTAVKSFVAAARYQNFTRAAESLCVTQAAISRQVRELEGFLGTDLFKRVGRSIELTQEGSIFFDAAQLSFLNIAQAADRIRNNRVSNAKRTLTLCCSPAFSAFWLSLRLPSFFSMHSNIDLQVLSTENFLTMEPGVYPDIFITKMQKVREGYHSIPLFHDVIYPICTPSYLAAHPEINTLEGLRDGVLLNLSPYGRSQVSEHVNWESWLAIHKLECAGSSQNAIHTFNANDYSMLIHMTLKNQGVALGWDHLVGPLVADGQLVKPIDKELVLEGTRHYLAYREDKATDETVSMFREWFMSQCADSVRK